MALTKISTTQLTATQSEKCLPRRKRVKIDSKFVVHGDEALQSESKRRRYMRRGSKSASMFEMAAATVKTQYDTNERVMMDIRGSHVSPSHHSCTNSPSQAHEKTLRATLKLYSTKSLFEEMVFLEEMLGSSVTKTTKIVMV